MADDEYKDDHIEEEGPPSAPSSSVRPTVQPFSHGFVEFPGLPGIKVPSRAFEAKVKVSLPSGSGRDSNTIIVNRGERGMAALEPRNMEPSEAQQALRDFSHLYPVFVQKWDKGYLNEVAFATKRCVFPRCYSTMTPRQHFLILFQHLPPSPPLLSHTTFPHSTPHTPLSMACSKAIAEAHMLEGRRKMLAEEKKAQQALFPHRKKNPEGESGETFFDRCAAMDKRLQEKRVKAVEDYEKAQRPPPTAKKWGEVQDNFLKRWIDFNKKREENLEKLDQETMPPFRQPGSEPLAWEDVQDHFLGSQAECTARIEARVKASEEAMKSKATKEGGAEFKMK